MALIFKRSSLIVQVADLLRVEVLNGVWSKWIPSEREISRRLHVSRNTCRAALRILRKEKAIESVPGRGSHVNRSIVHNKRGAGQITRTVGVIIPQTVNLLRPETAISIDELRDELFDLNVRLDLHDSASCYTTNSGHVLEKLVERNHHACWILLVSQQSMQTWMMKHKVPCVVLGSTYPGINLPSVDYDCRAICRHAAGQFIARGHKRLVFLNRRRRAAGDLESEVGFLEGANASRRPEIEARVVYHDDSGESVSRLIRTMFADPARAPTGLLVANSYCYLSVTSTLARLGLRAPDDFSLISRNDDEFLSYLDPEPARYTSMRRDILRKVMTQVRLCLDGGASSAGPARLTPRFIAGGSIGSR